MWVGSALTPPLAGPAAPRPLQGMLSHKLKMCIMPESQEYFRPSTNSYGASSIAGTNSTLSAIAGLHRSASRAVDRVRGGGTGPGRTYRAAVRRAVRPGCIRLFSLCARAVALAVAGRSSADLLLAGGLPAAGGVGLAVCELEQRGWAGGQHCV